MRGGGGEHAVHDDPVAGPLAGGGAGERADGLVGRGVGAVAGHAGEPDRGAHGDDAAPLLRLHVREHRLHAPERALGSGVEQEIHVAGSDVFERGDGPKALRVGDEAVDTTEALDGARRELEAGVAVGHVAGDRERLGAEPAQLLGDGFEALDLPARDHDAGARQGEIPCDPTSDPTAMRR